jgi:hypothetical protein
MNTTLSQTLKPAPSSPLDAAVALFLLLALPTAEAALLRPPSASTGRRALCQRPRAARLRPAAARRLAARTAPASRRCAGREASDRLISIAHPGELRP